MSTIAPQTRLDPLHPFVAGAFVVGTQHPIPLVATRFNIEINCGLAIVATNRTFRNIEDASIEATITFPVPVHAVLFALEARIDGRVLKARAQRKSEAREVYEDALERGKTAVLHEEVLRGVHMLSIGHISPGADVEVLATWAITLTNANGRSRLRIPLTVGEIYGRSPLPDSDGLTQGGPVQTADVTVRCYSGQVKLLGGHLEDGRASVPLNAPIDLEVSRWAPADLCGRAADGRQVVLRVEPTLVADAALDVAILVDHSGSMGEALSFDRQCLTKHQAVAAGLQTAANMLGATDHVDLWEFDNVLGHVGTANSGAGLHALVRGLSAPSGGTEIGDALAGVIAQCGAPDVLLVTDGKSYALDVHALAQTGRRFSVVLVGEDSLEANVGHLAALTGGETFVAAGADLADMLNVALRSLRAQHYAVRPITGKPQDGTFRRAGMTVTAKWQQLDGPMQETTEVRAVAAVAASLVLPALNGEAASALAEAEGLVTHLTSLVLVDEAAAVQESVPANRKISLPAPRARALADSSQIMFAAGGFVADRFWQDAGPTAQRPVQGVARPNLWRPNLSALGERIAWDVEPQRLQVGDLSKLDPMVAQAIRDAATIAEISSLARQLDLDPVVLIVGLIARAEAPRDRTAARIAKAIFGDFTSQELDAASRVLRIL